ncbi:hypothetical protein ES708_31651 [subsurface metagenome]
MQQQYTENGTWDIMKNSFHFNMDLMNMLVFPIPMICGRLILMAQRLPIALRNHGKQGIQNFPLSRAM